MPITCRMAATTAAESHQRTPRSTASRAALLLTLGVSVLLAAAPTRTAADAFQFAPLVNVYAVQTNQAMTYDGSQQACTESGGYLACEPTAATHKASINAARTVSTGRYFAFLGGDTRGFRRPTSSQQCPQDALTANDRIGGAPLGNNPNCIWHWNQGRWITFQDDMSIPSNIPNAGIAFFKGNYWQAPWVRTANSMANYFHNDSLADGSAVHRRPGMLYGRNLVLVGSDSESAVWSDNNAGPGYQYEGYTYNPSGPFTTSFNPPQIGQTTNLFISVCNTPTPSRIGIELDNTTSGLQMNWWAILFAVIFGVCFVIFIIIACCQEREDMDEPPEDAPEWAQKQATECQRNRTFVSQRSFRAYDDDDDDAEENGSEHMSRRSSSRGAGGMSGGGNPMNAPSQRQGSLYQGGNQRGAMQHRGADYEEENF